jgi:hypothetical protein
MRYPVSREPHDISADDADPVSGPDEMVALIHG